MDDLRTPNGVNNSEIPCGTGPGSTLARLASSALEGLFPNYCCLCGLRSFRSLLLCHACEAGLLANTRCCRQCALPIKSACSQPHTALQQLCAQCLLSPPPFDRVVAPWLYDQQMALLIHRWKYRGERSLSPLLAYLWLSQLDSSIENIDLIVPVPLHWSRFWKRGFNQSQLFAVELRAKNKALKKVQIASSLVQRHRATAAQSTLDAVQRKTNLIAAFTAKQRCDNLRIAIVDDVLTTGATATAMATTLRDAGARHIEIWCLARTPEPKDS